MQYLTSALIALATVRIGKATQYFSYLSTFYIRSGACSRSVERTRTAIF
jgi:hypothetical protein